MDDQKQYQNLKEIITDFMSGQFQFESSFNFNHLTYKVFNSTQRPFLEYIQGKSAFIIYSVGRQHSEEARELGADQWLAFVWKTNSTSNLSPVGIVPTTEARHVGLFKEDEDRNIIGDVVNVSIVKPAGFAFGAPIKGKIDSGASMCSLHVDSWKEQNGNIEFKNSQMAENKTFVVPKENTISIKSAEHTEYRPVITMSLRINDNVIPDIQVNLNNRNSMKYPLLIGQNALEKGKFLIDPSLIADRYEDTEQFNDDDLISLEETINNFDFNEQTKNIKIKTQYEQMLNSDISFADILRHIKSEAT